MWDNWFKNVDDLYTYKYWKEEVKKYNKRVVKFWKDFYADVFNKKDD